MPRLPDRTDIHHFSISAHIRSAAHVSSSPPAQAPRLQFSTCSGSTSPVLHQNKPYPTIQPSSHKTAARARGTTAGGGAAHSPARLLVAGDCSLPPPKPLPRARTPLLGCWLLETESSAAFWPPSHYPKRPSHEPPTTTAEPRQLVAKSF
jgi:hypothetical protein